MRIKAIAAGIAGSLAMGTSAFAADPIIIAPPPPPPMVVAPVGFDWSGIYAGAHLLGGLGMIPFSVAAVGGQVGFNVVRGNLVFGAEAFLSAGVGASAGQFLGAVGGKVGFALGATQRALLYGTAFFAFPIGGGGSSAILFGPGVAFGVGNSISLFAELLPGANVGGGGGGGVQCCVWRAGVNFHFGP